MQNDKYMPPEPPGYIPPPSEAPRHGYPPQGYPQPGYPPQQGYPQPGYPQTGYPPQQAYTQPGYPLQQGYPQPGYPPQQGYPQPGYPQPVYPPQQGYTQPGYPPQNYPAPQQGYNPPAHNSEPPPTQNYTPPPTQAPIAPNRNQKTKTQSSGVYAAGIIFFSGGMNIAWSVGFRGVVFFLPQHTFVAWFIGVIIGAVFSGFYTNKVPKKVVLYFCSVLVLIGGILKASTGHNLEAFEASLYLDGIANGLAFPLFLALTGEVAVSQKRGRIAATIDQYSYITGFFIQIIYTQSYSRYNTFSAEQIQGVLSAVCGLIALIISAVYYIESPVTILANGQEQEAIDALRRLQKPQVITTETYAKLEEHKRYLAQNKDLSTTESITQGLPALLRLIYLRALNAMSLSLFLFYALLISSLSNSPTIFRFFWEFLVYAGCRWLGTLITSFCMESLGRKKPTLIGLLVSGGLLIGVASIISDFPYGSSYYLFPLLCVYQLFAGIAFTASSAYLSEAFPLKVKQHYIGITLIAEMLVYIIISCASYSQGRHVIFFCFLAGLSLGGFAVGIFFLPETRRTTLREAQNKFKGMISMGF